MARSDAKDRTVASAYSARPPPEPPEPDYDPWAGESPGPAHDVS